MIKFIKEKLKDELLAHSSMMFSATILGGLCSFLFQIYANHNLNERNFSLLYTLMTLTIMVGVIGMTVLTMVAKQVSHYKAKDETEKIAYLFTHILAKISLIALLGFLIYSVFSCKIASFFNRPDATLAVVITGMLMALSVIIPVGYGVLQGLQRFHQWSLSMIISSLSRLLAGVLLIYLGFEVTGAVSGSLIAFIVTFTIILFWLKGVLFKEERPTQVSLIEFYKTSWWILGIFLFGNIICFIDILIVQHFLENRAACYSSASVLGRTIFYLPSAIAASMFPKVSGLYAKRQPTLPLLKKTLLYSFGLCILAALTICALSKFIVAIVLDEIYLEAVPELLRLFVFALIPYALITILIYYNIAAHKVKVVGVLLFQTGFHIVILSMFHRDLKEIIYALAFSGCIIFISLLWFTLRFDHKTGKR